MEVNPFTINVPNEVLNDLSRRRQMIPLFARSSRYS